MSNAEPIRVLVGSESKTKVPFLVLRHSIISRTSHPVEVTEMGDFEPWLIPDSVHQATGFSLRRWLIPEVCNFQGSAIYLDADQIVLGDIAELWSYRELNRTICCCYRADKCSALIAGVAGAAVPQTSVMVINCHKCKPDEWSRERIFDLIRSAGKPHSPSAVKIYQKIMHGSLVKDIPFPLELRWNEFNERHNDTKLIHYTFESTQPWYEPSHPLAAIWEDELAKAISAGHVTASDLREAIALGKAGSKDWRKHGGMHPYYEKYIELAEQQK